MSLTILFDIDSSYLRIAFRIYFTLAFLLIGFLADKCLAERNQRRLVDRKSIPMTYMTGWLTNVSLLKATMGFRRLPGGNWFGMFMFACTILSLLSDLAVTGLVRSVTVPSRCLFGTGLVVPDSNSSIGLFAANNGAAYSVAGQAQITSAANGGLVGIYWKANRDLTFRADEVDLAGQWNCVDVNDDIEYVTGTTPEAIIDDLVQKNYLYGPPDSGARVQSVYPNGSFSHLVVWASSVPGFELVPFDVRVSIDLTPDAPDSQIMKSFHCTMNGTGVEWVLSNINSSDVLLTFVPDLQGNIYNGQGTPASNDSRSILEQYLNTLVMVAGGNGYVINSPAMTGEGAGNTQGCLVPRTSLPLEIILLSAIVSVFAVTFVVDFICSKIRGLLHRADVDYLNQIKRETPNSLLDWMAQSVRECLFRDDVRSTFRTEDLKLWGFSPRDNGIGLGVVQRMEER
jgi:hypothetical protein